jgi:hypothetical protein
MEFVKFLPFITQGKVKGKVKGRFFFMGREILPPPCLSANGFIENRRRSETRNQKSGSRIGEMFDYPQPQSEGPVERLVVVVEAAERGAHVPRVAVERAPAQNPPHSGITT